MSNLLKDIYSRPFYNAFSSVLEKTLPSFDREKFLELIFCDDFKSYELKERMAHTAKVLHHFLSTDFPLAMKQIQQIIDALRSAGVKENNIEYMFLPEYISMYGLDDYESSVEAMEYVTQFTSCEFAVRPFILRYPDRMIPQMLSWSKHSSNKVRRLASESSRPRLPWAMALPFLKKDPAPILPILENLKMDECEVVRRSVANNLNDIAKDNPDMVVEIALGWKGISKETDAIIRHACRTLLKNAHPDIMRFYGLEGGSFSVTGFSIQTPVIKMGEHLEFTFSLKNQTKNHQTLRLEYGLYYLKNNGKNARKVFKISERELQPGEQVSVVRKHSFRPITTRKFYVGEHQLSIILNGEEKELLSFALQT